MYAFFTNWHFVVIVFFIEVIDTFSELRAIKIYARIYVLNFQCYFGMFND